MQSVERLDVVWDVYSSDSLTQTTRNIRGHGIRRRVVGHGAVPSHWQGFLRRNENKTELFAFHEKHIEAHNVPGKQLLSTDVVSQMSYCCTARHVN